MDQKSAHCVRAQCILGSASKRSIIQAALNYGKRKYRDRRIPQCPGQEVNRRCVDQAPIVDAAHPQETYFPTMCYSPVNSSCNSLHSSGWHLDHWTLLPEGSGDWSTGLCKSKNKTLPSRRGTSPLEAPVSMGYPFTRFCNLPAGFRAACRSGAPGS